MRQAMAHRDPSSPTPMPTILRYGVAVLSVAIAIGLGFFLLRHFEAKLTPFLFAVAATVLYAGTGPGVLAIVLSVLSLNYFFLRPFFSFSPISFADLVYLTFCTFCALAVGWLGAARRRAEQELRQAREELEAKVMERTADLQRSEAHLAEAQRLSHTGAVAYNGTAILFASEETYHIWGFDPAQGPPDREVVFQRIHPGDRDWLNAEVRRAVGEKRRYSVAYRILLPDGTVKHLETIGQPVFSASGELVEIFATQTDVTERKRAEEALRESEAKFRDYAETASVWLSEIGPDYKYMLRTENAFGSGAADRIGTACWDRALDLETEPEKWRLVWETLDSRKPFRDFVYRSLGGNGSPMYVKASGQPVFDADGEFRGYRGTGTDVTALVRAQEEHERLRQLESDLAHMNRLSMMGELAASLAHEIAQPIATARNNARAAMHFLDRNPPDLGQVREALACVVDDADRAGAIRDGNRDQ